MKADLLIRGAVVYDGTGSPGRRDDVAVAVGRIAARGEEASSMGATRTIEADGLALAPGFIDVHSHSDFTLPSYPNAHNSVSQGVTTEVTGNCGSSPAPLSNDPAFAEQWRARAGIAGERLDWGWSDFATYLERLDAARPSVNVAPLVGHGALRTAVMGMRTELA